MITDFEKKIETAVAENPAVKIETLQKGESLSKEAIEDLKEEFSVIIPSVFKELLSLFNGYRLKWIFETPELSKEKNFVEGSIRILNFQDMMIGFDGRAWLNELWQKNMPSEKLNFYKNLKPFDYYAADNVECVCVQMSEQRELTSRLWLFRQGADAVELEFTLEEYFGHLIKTRGIWGWQYLFAPFDLKNERNLALKLNCEFLIEHYGKIFQDGYEKELKQRYTERLK